MEEGSDIADENVGLFHRGEVSAGVDVGPAGHVMLALDEAPDADVVRELNQSGGTPLGRGGSPHDVVA